MDLIVANVETSNGIQQYHADSRKGYRWYLAHDPKEPTPFTTYPDILAAISAFYSGVLATPQGKILWLQIHRYTAKGIYLCTDKVL